MKLEELKIYQVAIEIGEEVWSIVKPWDYFTKITLGKQIVKASDSIASNISEGFGRYHYKESRTFYFYARGSAFETKTWIVKLYNRKLITEEIYKKLMNLIEFECASLNSYIKTVGPK
ncbi:MAG: four helix bundle protein [Bacteroidales bacterium]|nr:four helix bundle protein [Bacteroidales bacterium]